MNIEQIIKDVRNVPDFPVKGIQFKDFTPVFANPAELKWMREQISALYKTKGITKVIGIESRGFILAPAIAMDLGAGFVPIRKPGKLPAETMKQSYQKEYGLDTIEIHRDALQPEDVVLLHDDLLATGGSMAAAVELVRKFQVKKIYINFISEIAALNGREPLAGIEITSLLSF